MYTLPKYQQKVTNKGIVAVNIETKKIEFFSEKSSKFRIIFYFIFLRKQNNFL